MRIFRIWSLAAFAGLIAAGVANAASLSIDGTARLLENAHRNDVLSSFGQTTPTQGYSGSTVRISGASKVRVSFVGFESAYNNKFSLGGKSFQNADLGFGKVALGTESAPSFDVSVSEGVLSFSFSSLTSGASVSNGENAYGSADPYANFFATFGGTDSQTGNVLTLFFDDDGASKDSDYDDMVIQITIIPNPLPASGIMLLGGLGCMVYMRRRKHRAG